MNLPPPDRSESQKAWYRKNVERIKARNAAHRLANLEAVRARQRKWQKENPEVGRRGTRRYRARHLEECRRRSREHNRKNADKLKIYNKEYRKRMPAEVKARHDAAMKKWAQKNSAKRSAYNKEYRAKNLLHLAEINKKWRNANPPTEAEKAIKNEKSRLRYLANRAERRKKNKAYRKLHPEVMIAYKFKRRALEAKATINLTSIKRWIKTVRSKSTAKCYWCSSTVSTSSIHFDHIVPLSKGGAHSVENLCVACEFCNLSKGVKSVRVWTKVGQQFLEL